MEEERKDVAESVPSKEEILQRSREENKNGDERERKVYEKGMQLAYCVTCILIAVMQIVLVCFGEFRYELTIIFCGLTGAYNITMGLGKIKLHKVFLICGITISVIGVVMSVLWVLKLCGIAL